MQKQRLLVVALMFCLCLGTVMAADKAAPYQSSKNTKQPPGYEAAQTISMITGVAISPLLGVGAVGCYQYIQAPAEKRAGLHWFAQPWFWIPALLIVGILTLKDVLGPATPTLLKKPVDVAEAIENKISGLIAAGAFIPLITQFFPAAAPSPDAAQLGAMGFAALDMNSILNLLMTPFAIALFVVVWLASHAINILILISPFSTVDTVLKGFRASLLSLVAITHFINPYLGAFFSIILIVFAYFIAGWSFRLLVLGQVFIWDYITFRRVRYSVRQNGNALFTACKINKTPVRTYGKLFRDADGKMRFEFRPWLFLPKQVLELEKGSYFVGRGIFFPEIHKETVAGGESKSLFILPPRYQTHEEAFSKMYQLSGVQDIGLLKGFKAIVDFLRGLFGFQQSVSPVASSGAAT